MWRPLAILVVVVVLAAAAAPLRAAVRPPASRPADPAARAARDAVTSGSLAAFAGETEAQLRAELEKGSDLDPAEVLRLATWREFGRYFGRVNDLTDGQRDTLAWLTGQPDVLGALMMAVSTADPPERVLEVLRALRGDHRGRIGEYPELAAAVCVVWDAHERFGGNPEADEEVKIDPAEPSRVFAHFAGAAGAGRLSFDPRKLPLELLVYVVDLHLTPPEIEWATRYAGARPNVAAAFSAVPSREGVYYDRAGAGAAPGVPPGEVHGNSYVLPNLLRRGGGVMEQAYFAAEVAKANGVPAAVGVSTIDGPVAAWTGFLQGGPGGRATWDTRSARHPQHRQWIGFAQDPQTYAWRSEAEMAVLGGVVATSGRDRLTSMALCKSAPLLPHADAQAEMLRRAVTMMPANRHAWHALADLAAKEKFDDAQMKPVDELLRSQLDRRWPEFATVVRLRALEGRGTIEFDRGIDKAADAVRDLPDLVAMVRLAQVERYREDKRNKEAVELLVKLLQRKPPLSPPSALAVMLQLDDLLHREDDLPRLNEIYRAVVAALPKPNPSHVTRTTPYWRIGWKYAELLDELKDPQAAGALRAKLESLVLPPPAGPP